MYKLKTPFLRAIAKIKPTWVYPIIILLLLTLLVSLGVSGSSVGVFTNKLTDSRDQNLLAGRSQDIRSDEWGNWSVLTVSQAKNNYQKYNENLSTGQSLALQQEVPIRDWSTIFRPHNWGFFVLPLENGFALRWWFLFVLLLISSYFFALIHIKKIPIAILVSIFASTAPFILWWYQTALVGVLAYGFLFLIIIDKLIKTGSYLPIKHKILRLGTETALLSSLMMAYVLLFYPPFQIPVAIVVLFYFLGNLLEYRGRLGIKIIAKRAFKMLVAAVVFVGLFYLFIIQNIEVFSALSNSIYPGDRVVNSGGFHLSYLLNGFLMPFLQSASRAGNYFANQSEASNFLLTAPFLLVPSVFMLIFRFFKTHKIDWVFLFINACLLLFLANLFLPLGQPLYKLLLLDKVPHPRLLIGFGMLSIVQLVYFFKNYLLVSKFIKNKYWIWVSSGAYGLLCFTILLYILAQTEKFYPHFAEPMILAISFAAIFTSAIVAILIKKLYLSVALLVILSALCSFRVMPLYRGLSPLTTNDTLIKALDDVSNKKIRWATVDSFLYEGAGSLVGDFTVTGVNTYPDTAYWEAIVGPEYASIYNRQGHVHLHSDFTNNDPVIKLVSNNTFSITASCDMYKKMSVDYILVPHKFTQACTKLVKTINFPRANYYIYKIE